MLLNVEYIKTCGHCGGVFRSTSGSGYCSTVCFRGSQPGPREDNLWCNRGNSNVVYCTQVVPQMGGRISGFAAGVKLDD